MVPSTTPQQQQIINQMMQAVSGPPIPYDQLYPFSQQQAISSAYNQANADISPYYNQILQNYQKTAALNMQKYQNEYNTTSGYLSSAQKNFMNYHLNKFGSDFASKMGSDQGAGVGSSSETGKDAQDLLNDYNYTTNDYNLSNQEQQQEAKNAYNYGTQSEQQQLSQNEFQNSSDQSKAAEQYANTLYNTQYLQPYLTQKSDYYTNQSGISQNYLNTLYNQANPST